MPILDRLTTFEGNKLLYSVAPSTAKFMIMCELHPWAPWARSRMLVLTLALHVGTLSKCGVWY